MADLPTGTVTFLFTDIEGSTSLWERKPDQMRLALARHHAILRTTIADHGGHTYKTIGDAFQAAFALPAHAVAAALAAQRAFATQTWETSEPVRVRMGLHTGVAIAEGNDYSTTHTLNRVARIMAAGHGGQILLSAEVADLVRRDLPTDVTLRDMGTHRMKGLTHLEHLFQLVAPDLPAAFPPLKTLDHHPNNLPLQPTLLIGREHEIASACALLGRPDVRLLTLIGPGGTGKTRLALQVAAELLDDFADGVYFVTLAPITDSTLIISAIATTLGVKEVGGQPLLETLQTALHAKHRLLLLDNFEQVVAAAPFVAELLAAAPHVKVLVTSRAALHLSGEREFAVPPLALPDRTRLPALEQLTQYAAVRLFIERAQAVQANFVVTNANAPAVAQICHQLDGLPLAIILAAARIKLFPPQALLARLGNRLKLLTGGARDLPQRQQTIRDAIAWSYDLLDLGTRTLFCRLAVFVGGWTLEAAETVCGADNELPIDVIDGIASLLDKSLIQRAEGRGDEPRFAMLETIREYAREKLRESGEAAIIRQRHLRFFLTLAEAAEPKLDGAEQSGWLDRLEHEHDNLRAAVRWALEYESDELASVQAELGLQLAGALSLFWLRHSHWSEGRSWLREAIAHCPDGSPVVRAKALLGAAMIAVFHHDLVQGVGLAEQSLTLYRAQNDQRGIANALLRLGMAADDQGDYARAVALTEESLRLHRRIDNKPGIADALNGLGEAACYQGDDRRATLVLEECLAVAREMGDRWRIAVALKWLSFVALNQGHAARARALASESLMLHRELDDWRQSGSSLYALALACRDQGDYLAARALLAEALALLSKVQEKLYRARALEALAGIAVAEGEYERAARVFGAAEAFCETFNMPVVLLQRAVYERNVAAVRAHLDAATLAAAWAEGRALPLEQAIAYALESPPEVTPPTPPPVIPEPIPASAYPAGMTEREVEVLRLLAQGLSYAEIAAQLVISPRTVNRHLTAIYSKLDVTSRHAATRFAIDHQLV